jgi:hypothetical protein
MRHYGCFNREPFKTIYIGQNGYWDERNVKRRSVDIQHAMTTECQYSKTTDDIRCDGCKHKNFQVAAA